MSEFVFSRLHEECLRARVIYTMSDFERSRRLVFKLGRAAYGAFLSRCGDVPKPWSTSRKYACIPIELDIHAPADSVKLFDREHAEMHAH